MRFVLSTSAVGRRVQFTDIGPIPTAGGGGLGGSFDFFNGNREFLTFEPGYYGAGLNLFAQSNADTFSPYYFGSYYIGGQELPNPVPEPGAMAFGAFAAGSLFGLIIAGRKRRRSCMNQANGRMRL